MTEIQNFLFETEYKMHLTKSFHFSEFGQKLRSYTLIDHNKIIYDTVSPMMRQQNIFNIIFSQ